MDMSSSFHAKAPAPSHHHHKKSSWPELVGVAVGPAVTKIIQDRPDVAVEVLPPGSKPVIPSTLPKRVGVSIGPGGVVIHIPLV